MDRDKKLRKITQHVWNFISFKVVLTTERPVIKGAAGINADMVKLLRMCTWTGTYVSLSEWRGFLYDHYTRMTTSPKRFASYVVYCCYLTKQCSKDLDAYQIFLRIMSLTIQLALYSSNDQQEELLAYSQDIFIEFFEKELKKDFKKKGGWNGLGKYLQQRNPTELYKLLEKLEEEGKYPAQIVKILGMAHSKSDDQLTQYLSRTIEEAEIVNYEPTSRILRHLSFLEEATFKTVRVKDTDKLRENDSIKTDSTQELSTKPKDSNAPSTIIVDGKNCKMVFKRRETPRPTTPPPNPLESSSGHQRITTRQTYLRAKSVIQDLRLDFQRLEELLEFVFGEKSTQSYNI